jgi:hypothetical protein
MTDIIITMPDTKKEGIEKLQEFYQTEEGQIYFKVGRLPRRTNVGDRCHIVSNGFIIGSHRIISMRYVGKAEAEVLSDGKWSAGYYIIRDALTFELPTAPIEMKGFQGFRYREGCREI